jgi:hypothetical protein
LPEPLDLVLAQAHRVAPTRGHGPASSETQLDHWRAQQRLAVICRSHDRMTSARPTAATNAPGAR